MFQLPVLHFNVMNDWLVRFCCCIIITTKDCSLRYVPVKSCQVWLTWFFFSYLFLRERETGPIYCSQTISSFLTGLNVLILGMISGPDCEDNRDSLDHLCMLIPGDATLYSLFRIDAQPEDCPFKYVPN